MRKILYLIILIFIPIILNGQTEWWQAVTTGNYILDDEFNIPISAGSIGNSAISPYPSLLTRKAIDTHNRLSISGGFLRFNETQVSYADPMYWYDINLQRTRGRVIKFNYTLGPGEIRIVLDTSLKTPPTGIQSLPEHFGNYTFVNSNTWSWIDSLEYNSPRIDAFVLRDTGICIFSYLNNNWKLLHFTNWNAVTASNLKLYLANYSVSTPIFDWVRIPKKTFYPIPLISDNFEDLYNSSVGNVNPTTSGIELLADTSLEASYTGGLCSSLTKVGVGTTIQSSDSHTGTYAQDFTPVSGSPRLLWNKVTPTLNLWYRASMWAKKLAGNTTTFAFVNSLNSYSTPINSATYVKYVVSTRTTTTDQMEVRCLGGTDDVIFDDGSLQTLNIPSLMATSNMYLSDNLAIYANITLAIGSNCGFVLNLDNEVNPKYYILGFITYKNASTKNVELIKCVNGVYSDIAASTSITYVNGGELKLAKLGTTISLYYNKVLKLSGTVSDVGIISNTLQGKFSTLASNTFTNFKISKAPTIIDTRTSNGLGHNESIGLGAGGNNITWLNKSGTVNTNGQQIYASALINGRAIAIVNLNTSNVVLNNISYVKGTTGAGIIVRYQDTANYVYAYYTGTLCKLIKRINSIDSVVTSGSYWADPSISPTHTIGIVCDSNKYCHFQDNINISKGGLEGTYSIINQLQSAKGVGVIFFDTNSYITKFCAYARGNERQYVLP